MLDASSRRLWRRSVCATGIRLSRLPCTEKVGGAYTEIQYEGEHMRYASASSSSVRSFNDVLDDSGDAEENSERNESKTAKEEDGEKSQEEEKREKKND